VPVRVQSSFIITSGELPVFRKTIEVRTRDKVKAVEAGTRDVEEGKDKVKYPALANYGLERGTLERSAGVPTCAGRESSKHSGDGNCVSEAGLQQRRMSQRAGSR
jgi:hypothetical protein